MFSLRVFPSLSFTVTVGVTTFLLQVNDVFESETLFILCIKRFSVCPQTLQVPIASPFVFIVAGDLTLNTYLCCVSLGITS